MIPGVVASILRQPATASSITVTNTTSQAPTITTTAVTNFDQGNAQFNCTVGAVGTTRTGWQWRRTSDGLNYPFSFQRSDAGTSYTTSSVTTGTTYFVRAYATNINGVATFTVNVNLLNDAGTARIEYGPLNYNLSTATQAVSGNGSQTLTWSVSGLNTNDVAHQARVRIDASHGTQTFPINYFSIAAGTAYGSEVQFTTYSLRTFQTTTAANYQTWTPPSVGNGKAITSLFNVVLVGGGGAGGAGLFDRAGGGAGQVSTWSGPYTFSGSVGYVCGAGGGVDGNGVQQNGQFSALYTGTTTLTVNGGYAAPGGGKPFGSDTGGTSGNGNPGGNGVQSSFYFGGAGAGGGGGGSGGPGGVGISDAQYYGYGGNGGAPTTVAAQYGGGTYAGGGRGSGSTTDGTHYTHPGSGGQPVFGSADAQNGLVRFQYWGPA